MGLFSRMFRTGGGSDKPAAPAEPGRDELIARFKASGGVSVARIVEGMPDDDALALLWELLEVSAEAARVDVIDHIAEFDLDAAQQKRLLLAGVQKVPSAAWTGVSVAQACNLGELARSVVTPQGPTPDGDLVLGAVARILGAIAQAALTTGPAGDALDVEDAAEYAAAWADALEQVGAMPLDLVALRLCQELCLHEDLEGESDALGWDVEFGDQLAHTIDRLNRRGPREGEDWESLLHAQVMQGELDVATMAMSAAPWLGVGIEGALRERLQADPTDEVAQALALLDTPGEALLELLVPAVTAELQARRLRESELASLASQVGCATCGGPPKADEDDQMIPRALETKVMSVLASVARYPGAWGELIFESLAAPSPSLRFGACLALGEWEAEQVPAATWALLATLEEDSVPEVRERVEALLKAQPSPAPAS